MESAKSSLRTKGRGSCLYQAEEEEARSVVRLSRRGSAVGSPSGIGSAVGSALSAVLVSAAGVSELVE